VRSVTSRASPGVAAQTAEEGGGGGGSFWGGVGGGGVGEGAMVCS